MKYAMGVPLLVLLAALSFSLQTHPAGSQKRTGTRRDSSVARKAEPAWSQKRTGARRDSSVARKAEPADTLRKMPNKAFAAGENLKFNVYYGPVAAGEAIMRISDTVCRNRKCYSIEFSMKTKPFFDMFYKINDKYLSDVDADGLFPWHFEQHIREGGFERDFTADFDQVHHLATTSEGTYPIPPYVHDIMSALYFARTIDYTGFQPGQKVHLQNFYKDSTYELDVTFKGKQ